MPDYTTTALLRGIRRRGMIPTAAQQGGTDDDLLAMATQHLQGQLSTAIRSCREEFFEDEQDIPLSSGVAEYDFPTRALGGSIRKVWLLEPPPPTTPTRIKHELHKVEPDEQACWRDERLGGEPCRFWVRSNKLIISPPPLPPPPGPWSIRVLFERRPNALIPPSAAMAITSVPTVAPFTYLGAKPASLLTTTTVDVIRAAPHFDHLIAEATPTAVVSGVSVTFAAAVTGAAVGDYIALAGESPVPQVPAEFHQVLEQLVACQWLRNMGYTQKLVPAEAELKRLLDMVGVLIDPRVFAEVETLDGSELFGGW